MLLILNISIMVHPILNIVATSDRICTIAAVPSPILIITTALGTIFTIAMTLDAIHTMTPMKYPMASILLIVLHI